MFTYYEMMTHIFPNDSIKWKTEFKRNEGKHETGKTNPDSYALIKLADFFDVTIDYLVGRSDNNFLTGNHIRTKLETIQKDIEELKRIL